MMHGCTEPSSTLHPYAFAIAAHKMTDPIGANANAPITRRASKYQIHGNRLCDIAFSRIALLTLLDHPVFLGPVPQRGELSWERFVRCPKMRPMVRQDLPKRHAVFARASWIGA